jgi:hypothetical protein
MVLSIKERKHERTHTQRHEFASYVVFHILQCFPLSKINGKRTKQNNRRKKINKTEKRRLENRNWAHLTVP